MGTPEDAKSKAAAAYNAAADPMVLGTGYRGTIEQLDADARDRVRADCLRFIRSAGVGSVEVNVVYATATRGSA